MKSFLSANRLSPWVVHHQQADCTTYWARHTWATIAYEIGTPDEFIAAALGHSYGNRTTAIYIDKRVTKVDDINRAVIDYVLNKKKAST
nr:hypothetical protein [uncultured Prevotella sp.]